MKAVVFALALCPAAALAAAPSFVFPNIDGGEYDTADWRGRPVLVVNTASRCGFTGQMDNMQALHERYAERGLVVLAAPSDDFNQELDDAAAVKNFCVVNYNLTVPMTDILNVAEEPRHPFYQWLKETRDFTPSWNFNKVLLDGAGDVVDTWGSWTKPDSRSITSKIEAALAP